MKTASSKQAFVKLEPDRPQELPARVAAQHNALKAQEVADFLGVTRQHVYKLAAKGLIPSFRVGKAVRFDPSAIAVWLQEKKLPRRTTGATSNIKVAV